MGPEQEVTTYKKEDVVRVRSQQLETHTGKKGLRQYSWSTIARGVQFHAACTEKLDFEKFFLRVAKFLKNDDF